MLSIIFALISFLGWGTGDVFGTIATRKLGSYATAFWGYLFGLIPEVFLLPFFLTNVLHFTRGILLLNIVLAIILLACWIMFNEALRIGNPTLVGTIGGAYGALVVLFSVIFLGDKLTSLQTVSISIIFIGFLLSSLNFSNLKKMHVHLTEKSILFATICLLGWGIYFTFIKLPIQEVGWFWPNFISTVIGVLYFLLAGVQKIGKPKSKTRNAMLAVFASAFVVTIASMSFNLAVSHGSSAIVAPIAGSYPALFVLLSSLIFKEPITRQQKFGIIVTILGIVILSFASA